jgi:hypothetical protein
LWSHEQFGEFAGGVNNSPQETVLDVRKNEAARGCLAGSLRLAVVTNAGAIHQLR